jgi:hypothetical protein
MHIEIKGAKDSQEIARFIAIIHESALNDGDTVTAHYPPCESRPNGSVIARTYHKWEQPSTNPPLNFIVQEII